MISILYRILIFISNLKLISYAMDGLDVVGARSELVAKLTDVRVDRAVAALKIVAPYVVEKLLS